MIYSGKRTKTLTEVINFDNSFAFMTQLLPFQSRWTQDMGKFPKDTFRSINAMYLSFVDKCDPVTLTGFIHDRRRGYNSNTLLFETTQHFPKLFAGNRIDSGSRFIQKKNIRFMNQSTA